MRNQGEDLALDTRRAIFELIVEYPGLHFREIVRRINMSPSNVEYHLRHLVKHDVLVVVEDGRLKRFYVKGKISHEDKKILSVLRKEIPRGIVLFLLLEPGSDTAQIHEMFNLSASQLSYYLRKLQDKDIIYKQEAGGRGSYFVRDEEHVASVLIAFRPSFMDTLVDAFADAYTPGQHRNLRFGRGQVGHLYAEIYSHRFDPRRSSMRRCVTGRGLD